ncbi:tetraacyldisaccharide 4'-kinase [Acetobacteraceae bacterium ESL0697]|nr:tetraacyldisaccharide 4'-kinase [Acetobacteraceae bacterium ESL0697]
MRLLSPVSYLTHYLGQKRLARPSEHVSVPVLCIGNITVGGAGKTPLTLDFIKRLKKLGHTPHVITRGYGGQRHKFHKVDLQHDNAATVGDEALLLAAKAPTWCGLDRVLNAQKAITEGADCLILDDGFQNPSLYKDMSLLVFDGEFGVGNNHLLPAGPLRETLEGALERTQGAVIIGPDRHKLEQKFPPSLPCAHLAFYPRPEIRALLGKQVIAFAGIGRPEKFFDMLREAGLYLLHTIPFPDHHTYDNTDLNDLAMLAKIPGTALVTTAKDAVKLPPEFLRIVTIVQVDLYWEKPEMADYLLEKLFSQKT